MPKASKHDEAHSEVWPETGYNRSSESMLTAPSGATLTNDRYGPDKPTCNGHGSIRTRRPTWNR